MMAMFLPILMLQDLMMEMAQLRRGTVLNGKQNFELLEKCKDHCHMIASFVMNYSDTVTTSTSLSLIQDTHV